MPAAHAAQAALEAKYLHGDGADHHLHVRKEVTPYISGSLRAPMAQGGVGAACAQRAAVECVVLVLKLNSDYNSAASVLRMQQAVALIQKKLYQHMGAFVHFVQMGHGGLAITAFGLPPFTNSAAVCARHAVAAGCAVRTRLGTIGIDCTVGVAAGGALVGCLPSASRHFHALLGRPVSLAIKMANACTPSRPLLVDDAVFHATRTRYNFEAVRAVQHSTGGTISQLGAELDARLLMTFALRSTKPVGARDKREVRPAPPSPSPSPVLAHARPHPCHRRVSRSRTRARPCTTLVGMRVRARPGCRALAPPPIDGSLPPDESLPPDDALPPDASCRSHPCRPYARSARRTRWASGCARMACACR